MYDYSGMETVSGGVFAAAAGILGAIIVASLVYYVLLVIAQWRIYTKAGEKGWKAIIPIYNGYVLYRIAWETKYFWIMLITTVITSVGNNLISSGAVSGVVAILVGLIVFVAAIVTIVISVKLYNSLSKAFGHGIGFTVGLIFLNPIFLLILAFGSSQYQGAQE